MKRLTLPNISFNDMLVKCSEGMEQVNVRNNFISVFPTFYVKEQQYQALSLAGNLYTYPKVNPLTNTTPVVGHLTKRKLVNLYENNLRDKDKPARDYYDALLVSSGERCPFCGDIGQTKNLDHFLPKAHFPEFSVMPLNLVPSCRDCNMGEKGQAYATVEDEQAIHPYVDKGIFYQEQWVYAEYIDEDDGAVVYSVQCPAAWSPEEKNRARNHFNGLDLANRYSLEAGKHLSEVIDQKNAFVDVILGFDPQATPQAIKNGFVNANLQPLIDSEQFANHWKKVMYQCLANSDAFFEI
ncbi:HNH endonuclease [Psychrosphaera sp. B3R10]|uniref:HNH endonuclease n=1 Tax=unclassified Psychrosphaera TaxID=2641570 RepID=UPI001C090E93|nr:MULTISPECIES: HNH endonuclease [unclassified Psychrosphaera]MBU2883664.1 HNH endonuclease [Psychrosphaera sp. I2R16]MBU2991014.1 HNH endonuclease [Psychrosphaera sp. B3R10]